MTPHNPILVLLVEDEPAIRILAAEYLKDAGFGVVVAASAARALEILLKRDDVGVLFTDVNMPGILDGLDLVDVVRRRWPAIKLVVTSGRALDRAPPEQGHFIAKPYALKAMARLIEKICDDGVTGTT